MAFALFSLPINALALLQLATLPLSLFSKLPQIRQNFRSQSTGQLSAFAVVSQIVGCMARLFTTATELSDILISAGFALALLLNCVLGVQMWIYWGKGEKEELWREPVSVVTEKATWVPETLAGANDTVRSQSPSPLHGSQSTGRKWTRKVD
jgi:mannose-P-dolichol utilization defect protein 1